jgi:hypothetical protein
VDLLSTEFLIFSWDFLSYEALAVIICSLYAKTNHLQPDQVRRIRQWFWRSSFGERYKVGGESFVSNDIKTVSEFVLSGSGSAEDFGILPTEKDWLSISFRSNVSRSRAYILALAARHPRNLTNGASIDVSLALSSYNKKQFHHVYPRAYLKKNKSQINDNLVINICMLAAAANNEVSDSNPNLYLPQCADKLGQSADSVFASNLLPKPSSFDYENASYEMFLHERAQLLVSFVGELCEGHVA